MAPTLLKVSGLKVAYGGIQAVKGVSFEVLQGELVSLIGANGAGKTTRSRPSLASNPWHSARSSSWASPSRGRAPGTSSSKAW